MTGLIILTGLAAGLLLTHKKKHNSLEGVGRVKFYKALAEAQDEGVEFGDKKHILSEDEKQALYLIGKRNNYKQSRSSEASGRGYSEAFYRYLNNKYRAIAGIGEIDYPFQEYIVRNERGDAIVIFHDYDRQLDLKNALDIVDGYTNDPERFGEMATYAYLADGGKFVWESKFSPGKERVARGVKDELFGGSYTYGKMGKEAHPEEKKRRRKILATEANGGVYPEKFAEQLAAGGDSNAVRNGVLAALRSVTSPKDAEDLLLEIYYSQFDRNEPDYHSPF